MEGTLVQVVVDVSAVPTEAPFQRAVVCDTQREDAQQLVAAASPHSAGRDTGSDSFRHKCRFRQRGRVIAEKGWGGWAQFWVPIHAESAR